MYVGMYVRTYVYMYMYIYLYRYIEIIETLSNYFVLVVDNHVSKRHQAVKSSSPNHPSHLTMTWIV